MITASMGIFNLEVLINKWKTGRRGRLDQNNHGKTKNKRVQYYRRGIFPGSRRFWTRFKLRVIVPRGELQLRESSASDVLCYDVCYKTRWIHPRSNGWEIRCDKTTTIYTSGLDSGDSGDVSKRGCTKAYSLQRTILYTQKAPRKQSAHDKAIRLRLH
jgi:hypothetical protein